MSRARRRVAAGRRRPRVLYLAFFFPPSRASGVYRPIATANLFARRGWDTTVLTAPREFFTRYISATDESLEATVDPSIRVERPRLTTNHMWERELDRLGTLYRHFPTAVTDLTQWYRGKTLDEFYSLWIPGALARAATLHARRRFDLIVATGNPFASFIAAWALGRALRVPYVLDYRDAWTLDLFEEEPAYPPEHRAWRWEQRAISGAAESVFVNEPLRQWHRARYPEAADRMTVVPNGWEPDLLDGFDAARKPAAGRPLRFGYLGTVSRKTPMEEFLAGWRQARSHPLLADAEFHVHGHLGFFPHHRAEMEAMLGAYAEDGVVYRGPVPKAEVGAAYGGLDGLVFLAGGARYVTSGKIFEYMGTGLPVVSAHRPGIAAADILADYPLWFGGDGLEPERLAAALAGAAEAARKADPAVTAAARAAAARYTREAALLPFEQRMRRIVGAPDHPDDAAAAGSTDPDGSPSVALPLASSAPDDRPEPGRLPQDTVDAAH